MSKESIHVLASAPSPTSDTSMWRAVDATTIEVNLDTSPTLPFKGAVVEWPRSSSDKRGWIKIERRDGDLFANGRKIVLHVEAGQKTSCMRGHDLRTALAGKAVLHPNIMDALHENVRLIPESWEQDERGRIRYIYFWAAGFRGAGRGLHLRYLYRYHGAWFQGCCRRFGNAWDDRRPAAILED